MSDSESSALSSPPPSDEEVLDLPPPKKAPGKKGKKRKVEEEEDAAPVEPSPARKKRPASPPHEFVLADNPDIAFIVMFRSRFSDIFPPKVPHFGPQDIERGIVDALPSSQVETLLCGLLALVLNRKKPVERGHYGRALEEAIQTQKHQWPRAWGGVNPLHGGKGFNTMTPVERLTLLKALVLWSLNTSEAVSGMIKQSYKQSRHDDDLNQPLSVQPWGRDGDKRRYWLIEGRDDTSFRLYRESNPALKNNVWISVGGTIEELRVQAQKLADEGTQASRRLSDRILAAIPRFEATEVKRKRREYKYNRDYKFKQPEGISLYEGRTRGKRAKYTFSDEEDFASDATSARRSARQSARETPADPGRPTVTASGRQVRPRGGGFYGESLLSGQTTGDRASPATGEYIRSEASEEPRPSRGRPTRAAARSNGDGWVKGRKGMEGYNSLDDEDEAQSSGDEWNSADNEDGMDVDEQSEVENMSEDDMGVDDFNATSKPSLVVRLRYSSKGSASVTATDETASIKAVSAPSETNQSPDKQRLILEDSQPSGLPNSTISQPNSFLPAEPAYPIPGDSLQPQVVSNGHLNSPPPTQPATKLPSPAPTVQSSLPPLASPTTAGTGTVPLDKPQSTEQEVQQQNGSISQDAPLAPSTQTQYAPPASS